MRLLEKILVATDFSPAADNAIRSAVSVAKTFRSKLILLHVVSEVPDSPVARDMRQKVTRRLRDVQKSIESEGVTVLRTVVASGVPFDRIIQHADNYLVNVIILGSGQKSSDEPLRLGINAEKVGRKANKPVWFVRADAAPGVKRILCPVDFSDPSRRALTNAIRLAREFKADLTVLTVIEPVSSFYPSIFKVAAAVETVHAERRRSEFESFLGEFDFLNINWKKEVRSGKAHEQILVAAGETRADLIVMGTVGRTGLARMLIGSVTEKVVRKLPCSIITVRSEHVIRLLLETKTGDIETHFKQGKELLESGFPAEAIQQFELCLVEGPTFAPAWEQLAIAYERSGKPKEAERCKRKARQILQTLWEQRVQAEIRSKHPFFSKGRLGM